MKKFLSLCLLVFVIVLNVVLSQINLPVKADTTVDNSLATFGASGSTLGANGVVWDSTLNRLRLNPAFPSASFPATLDSNIEYLGGVSTIDTLSWTPRLPFGKPIPASKALETGTPETIPSNIQNNTQAYYSFDDGTSGVQATWTDNSGNGNTIIANGGIASDTSNVSVFNNVLQLGSQQAKFPIFPVGITAKNQSKYSIAFWARPLIASYSYATAGSVNEAVIYEEAVTGATNPRISIRQLGSEIKVRGKITDGAGTDSFNFTTSGAGISTTPSQMWYHIAFVYDSTNTTQTASVYVNGQRTSVAVSSPTAFPNTQHATTRSRIGQISSGNTNKWQGNVDEMVFVNSALTQSEIDHLYLRGGFRIFFNLKSCDDPACSGEVFTGPLGTSVSGRNNYNLNLFPTLPINITLSSANHVNNSYIQYRMTIGKAAVLSPVPSYYLTDALAPSLTSVTIGYTPPSVPDPTLSFYIRNSGDTSGSNTCDLGTTVSTSYNFCEYRLKVSTNVASGFSVYAQTTRLTNGSYNINNALNGSSGGTLVSGATVGTEIYGVRVIPNAITTASTISAQPNFASTTNSVNYYLPTSTKIIEALGANAPATTDLSNTILIRHNLTVSSTTEGGIYDQSVIYTIVPNL
jgi:hypothetical protein